MDSAIASATATVDRTTTRSTMVRDNQFMFAQPVESFFDRLERRRKERRCRDRKKFNRYGQPK